MTKLEKQLFEAVENNNLKAVKLLIEQGVNVNAKDDYNDDWTLLHCAAYDGHFEIAKFLVKKGANVNIKDGYDRRPLHWAAVNGHLEIAKLLIKNGADVSFDKKDNYDNSLHLAIRKGNFEMTKLLVENGADVNIKDGRGLTPLQIAKGEGYDDIAEYLKKYNTKK